MLISQTVISILTNENSKKVLLSLFESDKSAQDLSRLLNIPLSTVYRILTNLEEKKLVKVSKMILNSDGHHINIYHTKYYKIILTIHPHDIDVECKLKDSERIIDMFNKLRDIA